MKSFGFVPKVAFVALLACGTMATAANVASAGSSGFTGAFTATDPDDQSRLILTISAPNASGRVRVTLIDQFATSCLAPATVVGAGTLSEATVSGAFDVRCGGAVVAEDVPFTITGGGDTVTLGDLTFTRIGAG